MSDPFDLPAAHPFGIHNLPYAVFEHDGTSRVGSRLGDHVVDRPAQHREGLGRDGVDFVHAQHGAIQAEQQR